MMCHDVMVFRQRHVWAQGGSDAGGLLEADLNQSCPERVRAAVAVNREN
jgi:hypothetical protein